MHGGSPGHSFKMSVVLPKILLAMAVLVLAAAESALGNQHLSVDKEAA